MILVKEKKKFDTDEVRSERTVDMNRMSSSHSENERRLHRLGETSAQY
jgi:hypothetical protein